MAVPRLIVQAPRRALLLLVHGYRWLLSPMLRTSCRYEPSCSAYAVGALTQHGAAAGSYLAATRVLRCHPFCAGGFDPVPAHAPALFRRLFPADKPARCDADLPSSTPIPRSHP